MHNGLISISLKTFCLQYLMRRKFLNFVRNQIVKALEHATLLPVVHATFSRVLWVELHIPFQYLHFEGQLLTQNSNCGFWQKQFPEQSLVSFSLQILRKCNRGDPNLICFIVFGSFLLKPFNPSGPKPLY